MNKVHIGCGTIYLEDYLNIDVELPYHYLAADRPDLVDKNKTSVDFYYRTDVTRDDIESRRLQVKEVVVDKFGDAFDLGLDAGSLEEIRSVQLFEHFSFDEGKRLLDYWYSMLAPGGKVHIDVPDLISTAWGIMSAKTLKDEQWYSRLMFGSQRNEYNYHKAMYSYEALSKLLEDAGFTDIQRKPNIHFYPAFAIEGTKP